MVSQVQIADRYELLEPLGEGGMGVVYRALDLKTKSYVALKTMRDVTQPEAIDLFTKEWGVLASISHPNIIDIRDVGEIQENGRRKPFFVMPLLSGQTLGAMIAASSTRLTVERVVDIICQVCRGLQAAHERGLIHRDIKPSNVFVMDDDAVKIIDFGIAHLAGSHSATGLKGTWQYMAPEQIDLRPATALSDVFSLAVVCYEVLTARKPFARPSSAETAEAVRRHIPPPISEVNPSVSHLVSMVIHKAMAKQPMHRFVSAREFAEVLQKAQLNQPLDRFDRSRIQPRIERAKKAFAEGDNVFSSEILTELESEGHIDKEITLLRVQIEQASRRKKVQQLIESAKARVEQDEIPLALEKLQEVLEIDPDNAEALSIRASAETQRNERQIENWMSLARRHIEQHDFVKARQALEEVLKMQPSNAEALDLHAENARQEQESQRIRAEKEQLYGSAVNAYQNGEISSALTKLERILELGRETPEAAVPERDAIYQGFYNQVRSERDAIHNGYEECRRQFADKNFTRAVELCEEFLAKYPGDALFQAFKLEAAEQQRQELSAYIAEIGKRIDAEADLDRKVNIIKEACERYPNEQQFQQLLKLTRERRDLVLSIVAKARQYEEKAQFAEAIGQWDILRNIYPRYPGIDFEVGQLRRRREQQSKDEGKAKLVQQIDRALQSGDFVRARELAANALAEYTQDQELMALERLASQGLERSSEARKLVGEAQGLSQEGKFAEAIDKLRRASELNRKDPLVREALVETLVEQARGLLETDWRQAEPLAQEAATLDGSQTGVRHLRSLLADSKRKEFVSQCLAEAREDQAAGNVEAALEKVDRGMALYPTEVRLSQLQSTLQNSLQDQRLRQERNRDVESLKRLLEQVEHPQEPGELLPILEQSQAILSKHPDDPEIGSVAAEIQQWAQSNDTPSPLPNHAALAADAGGFRHAVRAAVRDFWSYLTEPTSPNRGVPIAHIVIVAGMIVLAVAAVIFAALPRRAKRQPAAKPAIAKMVVNLHVLPADASVTVNGQVRSGVLELDPNAAYDVSLARPGYRPLDRRGVKPAADWDFTLEPELVHLNILTAEKSGTVSIDGKEVGTLDGVPDLEWTPDAAEHVLSVKGKDGELLSFSFKAQPGMPPHPEPLTTKDLVVVGNLGLSATVYSGSPGLHANLTGQSPQSIPAEGLNLTGLSRDNHDLVFDRKDLPKVSVEPGNAPVLYVVLNSDPNVGSFYFTSNVENARLSIDGHEIKPARKGGWRIERRAGTYAVKLTAEGYEDFQERIEIAKGSVTNRKIELRARAVVATLAIQGGTPGAEVLLDGTHLTVLDSFGLAKQDGIAPGQHRITVRKEFFEPSASIVRVFSAGQSMTLSGAEIKLKEFGSLSFQVTPAEAQVSYRRTDQQETHTARAGDVVRVPEGRYVVNAQADGYAAKTAGDITASSGKVAAVELKLARVVKKPEPVAVAPSSASLFENSSRLEQVGEWWRAKGQGYAFLRPDVHQATITFSNPGKGLFGRSKKVEWVAHFVNEKEKIAYELDGNKLTRRATVNGVDGKPARIPHHLGAETDAYTISVSVEAGRISISASGQTLDTYEGQDLTTGMIGIKANTLFTIGK